MDTENKNADYMAGYKAGLLKAAEEVESHWNHYATQCNQKDQAARSAAVLRGIAAGLK